MATSTPWGRSQYSKQHGRGIVFYGTAGHGGFHVSKTLNAQMPDGLRQQSGWYEEDGEWAKVALAFPDRFEQKDIEAAKSTIKNGYPDAYEKLFNVVIPPGESRVKDQRAFLAEHANDLLTVAAWGSWHEAVPKGMVGVAAQVGGRPEDARIERESRYFLVPAEEYEKRNRNGLVIDLTRHQEVSGF
jgi:hypothetical protein